MTWPRAAGAAGSDEVLDGIQSACAAVEVDEIVLGRMRGAPERIRPWRAEARLETVRVG